MLRPDRALARKRKHVELEEGTAQANEQDSAVPLTPQNQYENGQSPSNAAGDSLPANFNELADMSFTWPFPMDMKAQPRARTLPRAFRRKMCNSIVKENGRAEVAIYYALDPAQCSLQIQILREHVPKLAMNLFGIDIEDRQSGWVIVSEHGSEVELVGELAKYRMSRCDETAIKKHIGKRIVEVIQGSPRRIDEVENGYELTRLLGLTIWGSAMSNGILEVTADPERLADVEAILWPR